MAAPTVGRPIYVVSGFPRSGTSMMMRAAEAGGIPCVYDPAGDADRNRNTLLANYVPNPHGFYEDAPIHRVEMWPTFRGKAVKVVRDNLSLVPPGERLAVAYMRRDPAEIKRSYRGIMSGPHPDPFRWLDGYHEQAAADVAALAGAGHGVVVLDYAAVVADPAGELARLGWPFDAGRAAATVDPKLYRHRGAA